MPTWRDMPETRSLRTIHVGGDGVRWQGEPWCDAENAGTGIDGYREGAKRLRRRGLAEGFLQVEPGGGAGTTRRAIAQQLHLAIDDRARYRAVALVMEACRDAGFASIGFAGSLRDDAKRQP